MLVGFKKIIVLFIISMVMFISPSHAKKFYYFGAYPGLINAAFMSPFLGSSDDFSGDVTVHANSGVVFEIDDILKTLDIGLVLNNEDLVPGDVDLQYILEDEDVIYASNVVETDGDGLERAATISRLAVDPLGTASLKVSAVVNQIEEGYKIIDIIVAGNCEDVGSTSLDAGGHSIKCDENGTYLLTSAADLLHISNYQTDPTFRTAILAGDYTLTSNVVFPSYDTVDWDGDGSADGVGTVGWQSLGYDATYQFTGTFDGDGNVISGLYINSTLPYRGFFGTSGTMEVSNLGLTNVSITSTDQQIGALVGEIDGGTIDNVHATGIVSGTSNYIGGLAGHIDASSNVTDSYSEVNVTRSSGSSYYTGGFAGYLSNSTVSDCYATGTVDGAAGGNVGGFSGYMGSNISNSYATGDVTSTGQYVGGLAGVLGNNKIIDACYTTGSVTGANSGVGGLVGQVQSGTINNSYSTSRVDAYSENSHGHAGGLVGAASTMTINNSYASGIITAHSDNQGTFAGGLLGVSGVWGSTSSINSSYSSWTTAPTATGGGINKSGGLVGGEKHAGVTLSNAGDKCTGKDEVTPTQCLEADANQVKADYQFGLWEDSIWENPGDFNPRLEWEIEGDVESTLSLTVPSACLSEDPFDGMTRSSSKYQIATAQQLLCLSQMPLASVLSEDYQLANDISFVAFGSVDWDGDGVVGNPEDATGFMPIGGAGNKFTGSLDGNGYSITNLYINRPTKDYVGLFGYANGATFTDLTLAAVNVIGKDYTGSLTGYMNGGSATSVDITGSLDLQGFGFDMMSWNMRGSGGMIGKANSATITGSSADVTITGKDGNVGGLIGNSSNSTISQNYTIGSLTIVNAVSYKNVAGGLIGGSSGTISENYSDMTVSMNGTQDVEAGGLIGSVSGGTVKNNYSKGSVTVSGSGGNKHGGGLVGRMSSGTVENSYATGKASVTNSSGSGYSGGLIGALDGTIYNSYAGWTAGNIPTLSATSTANIGGLAGGSRSASATIVNAFSKCNGMNEGTPVICPAVDGSLLVKADVSIGLWSDSVWEVLEQDAPKLEWETPGDIASNITVLLPSACSTMNPLDSMTLDDGSYLIDTKDQLLCLSQIQTDDTMEANYKLTADIAFNADETLEDWDGDGSADGATPAGWSPLGNDRIKFTGDFDGQDFTISNLYINRPSDNYTGLFGYVQDSDIINLKMTGVYVKGSQRTGGIAGYSTGADMEMLSVSGTVVGGSNYTGGIIGYANSGSIMNSSSSGTIAGATQSGGLIGYSINFDLDACSSSATVASSLSTAGGLIGQSNSGTINDVYATGAVSGASNIGGLIGYSGSNINNSYATGAVNSTSYGSGGFAGSSASSRVIKHSYATGNVSGVGKAAGFIGNFSGNVEDSYATGNVTATANTSAGFIGWSNGSHSIKNSFATGSVSGVGYVGGFAGDVYSAVDFDNCYSTGNVTGTYSYVGGFIGLAGYGARDGQSSPKVIINNCYATGNVVTGTTRNRLGGFVGHALGAVITNCYASGSITGADGCASSPYKGAFIGLWQTSSQVIYESYAVNSSFKPRGGSCASNTFSLTDYCSDSFTPGCSATTINSNWPSSIWSGEGSSSTPTLVGVDAANTMSGWSSSIWDLGGGNPTLKDMP